MEFGCGSAELQQEGTRQVSSRCESVALSLLTCVATGPQQLAGDWSTILRFNHPFTLILLMPWTHGEGRHDSFTGDSTTLSPGLDKRIEPELKRLPQRYMQRAAVRPVVCRI